jgi:hypothetical protein
MIRPEPGSRWGAVRLACVGAAWIIASLAAILAAIGGLGQGSAPDQAVGSYAWVGTTGTDGAAFNNSSIVSVDDVPGRPLLEVSDPWASCCDHGRGSGPENAARPPFRFGNSS